MRVTAGLLTKRFFAATARSISLCGTRFSFVRPSVGNHGSNILMKEIKHAVVYAPDANAKLVDVVTQIVGLGAAKLMA